MTNTGIFIIFFSIAFLILFASHYLLYFSINKFYLGGGSVRRKTMAAMLFFLGASFIASSFLFRSIDSPITRAYYFFSGFWLGLILNFSMAIAIAWLIIAAGNFFHRKINRTVLGTILLGLAMAFSVLGTWNVFHPRVKNITVHFPNLPKEWRGKKIIQISDLHLGGVLRARFARNIVRTINAEKPELVVITGDLMDGMDGGLIDSVAPVKDINARYGTYFVTGNHETYLGIDKAKDLMSRIGVRVLDDEVADVNGLKLIGVSYPERGEKKDIPGTVESLKVQFSGHPSVLLYHSPVNIDRMSASGVNLELCGHTHAGQLFPVNFITSLIYDGYDHGLFRIGNFTLYTNSGTGVWGPTMRTTSVPEIISITLE